MNCFHQHQIRVLASVYNHHACCWLHDVMKSIACVQGSSGCLFLELLISDDVQIMLRVCLLSYTMILLCLCDRCERCILLAAPHFPGALSLYPGMLVSYILCTQIHTCALSAQSAPSNVSSYLVGFSRSCNKYLVHGFCWNADRSVNSAPACYISEQWVGWSCSVANTDRSRHV